MLGYNRFHSFISSGQRRSMLLVGFAESHVFHLFRGKP
jgi:hypothetical protein